MHGRTLKRIFACCTLVGSLGLPGVALASTVTGTVSAVGVSAFTVQMPGRATGVINAMTAAANRVTAADLPYVYAGGHAQAGVASVGMKGPGYNGRRIGYDCSGSVAAVLVAGGLWPAGAGVPSDAGEISQLLRAKLIAPGAGTGPVEVTLYDDWGVHIFMNIDGRFFGTSDGGGGGDPRGGAGWLDDGAPDAFSRHYKAYHVLPSLLRASTDAGHSVTFQLGGMAPAVLQPGMKVQVAYRQTPRGTLLATGLSYSGALATSGVVQAIASDGSSLTLQLPDGSSLTLATSYQLLSGVAAGDSLQVTYVKTAGAPTAVSVTVTAPPAPPAAPTG